VAFAPGFIYRAEGTSRGALVFVAGMHQPLVSIVIDNYNYGRFVGAAIRSALAQTYGRLEVIVVDDGSTDDSRDVIRRFGDVVHPIFQENGGQSTAFNTGFLAAKGDIVFFLDSDDALHPDAVAEVVGRWRPGIAKVQFALATVDVDGCFVGNVFPNFPPGLTHEEIRDEVLATGLYPCPPTSGNAYARWLLEKLIPLPHIQCGADGPLNTVAPLYGEVVTIDRPLAWYRVHGANDGAQGALAVEKFARFIRHDQDRVSYMRLHAARLGFAVGAAPLDRAVLNLQYRMASLALRPYSHPVAGETKRTLLAHAFRALFVTRERLSAKLAILAWFAAVTVSGPALAQRLIALRFVPNSRPKALGLALRAFRVLRPSGAAPSDLSLPPSLAAS
jgi:glycosyltransferase involved in cell wall biosynthesis